MSTTRQRTAAKANIRKAQAPWKSMTPRQHALAQPEGRAAHEIGNGRRGKLLPRRSAAQQGIPEREKPTLAQKRAGSAKSQESAGHAWQVLALERAA